MADEAVKVDLLLADSVEKGVFSDGNGASSCCCIGNLAAFGANDCNLPVGLDGMREADAIFDYGAVACGFEVDVDFVLDRGRGLANFDSSEDTESSISSWTRRNFRIS